MEHYIDETYHNPYDSREVSLDMMITAPSGKSLTLPCYFDCLQTENIMEIEIHSAGSREIFLFFPSLDPHEAADSRTGIFISARTDKPGFLHKNDLWTFKFDDGSLFRGIGENIGWESGRSKTRSGRMTTCSPNSRQIKGIFLERGYAAGTFR